MADRDLPTAKTRAKQRRNSRWRCGHYLSSEGRCELKRGHGGMHRHTDSGIVWWDGGESNGVIGVPAKRDTDLGTSGGGGK